MNSITICGHIGRDAELRFLPDGKPVASFTVADQQGRDKPPIWWRCSLFGTRAESLAQHLTKGQAVTIIGQVTEREYTDKNGLQVKAQDVRVSDVALQGGRKDSAGTPPHPASAKAKAAPARPAPSRFDDDIEYLSDLPF